MSNTKMARDKCQRLTEYLKKQFTEHPARTNQGWGQHCLDTMWFSCQALVAGGALLVHALIPSVLQDWGNDRIEVLSTSIKAKHPDAKKDQ